MAHSSVECDGPAPVRTIDLLHSVGFARSGGMSLTAKFGTLNLSAVECVNFRVQPIVLLSGHYNNGRVMGEIGYELPVKFPSRKEAIAMLAYALEEGFRSQSTVPDWMKEGLEAAHLHPWEREQQAYRERPHCEVDEGWAALVVRALVLFAASGPGPKRMRVRFDGNQIAFEGEGFQFAVPATGSAWSMQLTLASGALASLPKRSPRRPLSISIWKDSLQFNGRRLPIESFEPWSPEHQRRPG